MDRFSRILALVMALLLTSLFALAEEPATVVQDGVEYRVEKDSMGEMLVPADRYRGAQTQRSHENFLIGVDIETMPKEIICAFGQLKLAAARANHELRKYRTIRRHIPRGTCFAALAVPFPPYVSCKFLDLPPVSLRNLQAHLTENSLAI